MVGVSATVVGPAGAVGDLAVWPSSEAVVQGGAMSELRPGEITDEMRQAMDTARRQGLQKDLLALLTTLDSSCSRLWEQCREAENRTVTALDSASRQLGRRPWCAIRFEAA
jgi:hypothetical protein